MPDGEHFTPIPVRLTPDVPLNLRTVFGIAWGRSLATLRAAAPDIPPRELLIAFRMFEAGFVTALSLVNGLSDHGSRGSWDSVEGLGRIVTEAHYHVTHGCDFNPKEFGL